MSRAILKKLVSAAPLGLKCGTHIHHINEERAVCNGDQGEPENRSLKTYTLYFTM